MKRKLLITAVLLLIFPFASFAQETDAKHQLTADFQFITRGEIRDGGLPARDSSHSDRSAFVLGRSRLVLGYQSAHITGKLSVDNTFIWGQDGNTDMDLNEGWVKLNSTKGLFLQTGRQILSYDDERILGANDWAMTGITHDAIKLGYDGKNHQAHLILAYNQNAENVDDGGNYYSNGALPYKAMQTAWYHCNVDKIHLSASLLFMNIGMQAGEQDANEHTEWQQVFGSYIKYSNKMLSIEGSAYKETGHEEHGLKVDAWMASIKGNVTPSERYGFEAGFDYLSGDPYFAVPANGGLGLTRHTVVRGFSSIYGSHHEFYGAMDFFYIDCYYNGFSPGLQNAYVGGFVYPFKKIRVDYAYHYMATSVNLRNLDMTLGHEFEFEMAYNFIPYASVSLGVSYMIGTETMQKLKLASDDGSLRWFWLSLNVNPRIFSKQWD